MTDPIADMLTRIRNALMARQQETVVPYSRTKFEIAQLIAREGFITSVDKVTPPVDDHGRVLTPVMRIALKYKERRSVISGLKRVSTPGRRVYYGYRDIPKTLPSLGVLIVSTPQGILTNREAKEKKVGGEVLCEIY
ncbi:MAG: 30S ribosomal protein S8 [Candidatus Kerfeldbacteria bacterium]|nr:30S ribosomal protein S8 [Candidatus Kerfeldbacteria bacterium]